MVQAIPTYAMSLFQLPKKLRNNIGFAMSKFQWSFGKNDKRIHQKKWEKMRIQKSKGGMSFRNLTAFNQALLTKQIWRILFTPNSLDSTTLRPFFMQLSLVSSIPLVKEGLYWSIGNGYHTNIWGDKWISRPTSFKVQAPMQVLKKDAYVRELMDSNSTAWNINLINQIFNQEETSLIHSTPISHFGLNDKIIWKLTKNRQFSIKSYYYLEMSILRDKNGASSKEYNEDSYWKSIWSISIRDLLNNLCGVHAITYCLLN